MNNLISKDECAYRKEQCYIMNLKPMIDKIDKLFDKVDLMQRQLDTLPEDLIEKLDGRYANKKIEGWFYAGIGLIITGFIVAVWELVVK